MNNKRKKELINIALFILGTILVSLTFNIFIVPNSYVTGGLSGISVVLKYLVQIDVSKTLLVGNLLLILIGIIVLGIKETTPSIIGAFFYTACVYLTEDINSILNIHLSSAFLNIITIGILCGVGYTMIYIAGYTTGGVDILGKIFSIKYKMPLGKSLLIINVIILLLGTITFGFEMLIITIMIRYLESKVIDSFLIGISDSKVMFINTEKLDEVNDFIIKEIKSTTSEIKIKSGYKKRTGKILMCVVPTEKYIKLRDKIIKIDPNAFVTILDAYEVYGGTNRYKLPLHDFRI